MGRVLVSPGAENGLKNADGDPQQRVIASVALRSGELRCDPLAGGAAAGSRVTAVRRNLACGRGFNFFFLNYHQVSVLQKS